MKPYIYNTWAERGNVSLNLAYTPIGGNGLRRLMITPILIEPMKPYDVVAALGVNSAMARRICEESGELAQAESLGRIAVRYFPENVKAPVALDVNGVASLPPEDPRMQPKAERIPDEGDLPLHPAIQHARLLDDDTAAAPPPPMPSAAHGDRMTPVADARALGIHPAEVVGAPLADPMAGLPMADDSAAAVEAVSEAEAVNETEPAIVGDLPSMAWSEDQLKAYAEANRINLDGAKSKSAILRRINQRR